VDVVVVDEEDRAEGEGGGDGGGEEDGLEACN
jgi:hypothetical protein